MAEHEGIDALLAAITEEPLPEGARDDARFMAEHRSAVADVALLREQLRIMGDTLAGPPPATEPSPVSVSPAASVPPASVPRRVARPLKPSQPPWYRRYAGVALGTLVVAAGTAMLGGLVWLGSNGGGDATSSADSATAEQDSGAGGAKSSSVERHLACAKVLAEGTVRSITPAGARNVSVVLEVERHYRPEQSAKDHPTITVTLPTSAREDLKAGTYTLVRVPVYAQDGQDWETGPGVGDARSEILRALPGARGLRCPGPDDGRG
ncbi:hypothetical protein [Streptomyces sp. NPDC006285]|uniref:hypothetical protein n=1 Tax=Streptomyces sp. NPDC006285 TaxID=3364742 RepID=UPI0036C4AB61